MTSVEKRRSSRRSRGHRKHSNGGFSSSSNGGSFLDETDREVSNLTDRAFRSLCIGDEAVYNDSDLSLSSPSTQRDRQLAFSQDRAREEQNRAEQESFSLRVQQHGQEWIFGGTSGADIHRDPQWGVYGERTQGMVSATFQHSFVGTSQQGKPLREGELSLFSNGASELSSQQRIRRSKVSSLVKAFNSDGHRDEAGMDDRLREWSDGTSWDRSALMSIQRELSEFSTSYQQNLDSHQFPSPFSQNTNFYSSQVGTMAQMSHNSASAYLTSSHMKDNKCAQVNSNFFMHSEFSPFRLWRDHDRFPFQQGELSGFMQCSEFPKWYQTPMYSELSFANQSQDPYRDLRHQRNTRAPEAHSTRSISSSTVTQKSSAVEKRCESELAGHYPHMRWTQRLGTNKLPSQRPSTASPTIEMSRRVRDTISSVKALQQKVKMMSVQNVATDETAHQQGALYGRAHLDNTVNSAETVEPNVFSSNTRSSFGTSQLLTPSVYAHQEAETSNPHHYDISPQPVEHPPVRAESRGATPDVRMSSYKSRATSLLFNLKDNRKRVKSTYSPTKFKGLDAPERNKQDPHETVIDIPAFSDPDVQLQLQEPRRTNVAANQYHNPGQHDAHICQPETTNTGQYPENTWAQTQGHAGFSSFIPGNYTNYQLANGQNPYEYVASFTPYKQDYLGSMEPLQQSYSAVDTARLNTGSDQSRENLIDKANTEQAFNETVGGVSSKVNRYEQLIENKQNCKNASSLGKWRQTNSQNAENVCLKTDIYPPKQEREPLLEQPRKENQSRHKGAEKELNESLFFEKFVLQKVDLVGAKVSNQLELERRQKANELKDGVLGQISKYTEQDGRTQHSLSSTTEKHIIPENTDQINQFMPELKKQENQSQQQIEVKQFEIHTKSSNPESLPSLTMTNQLKDRKVAEIKSEQAAAENARDSKAEETKTPPISLAEPQKTDSAELISSQKTGAEHIRRGELKLDPTKLESLRKAKQEEIKEEEQKEHFTKKEPEWDGDKESKDAQTRAEQLTDEPKCFIEKAENVHMTEEQAEVERAATEKLKDKHIRTNLPKTEEAEAEEPTRKKMNPDEVQEEQLLTEPTEGEQMETEQVENLNPEKLESRKEEQQVKELQTKEKHVKIIEDDMTEIKTDLSKADGVREVEKNTDFSQVGQKTAEKTTRPTCTVKDTKPAERKTEQATLKETKLDRCRAELSTTENLLERSDHLTAKLTASQHVRREPDKVEQVKTELAKAKAELAKIKEKMRGEQKEKVKNNPVIKDDGASKVKTPSSVNMDKTKDDEKQDQLDETQTHEGADDRERLGEICGFTNATTNMSTGSVTSDDVNEINEAGTQNNTKFKEGRSLACSFIAANAENKKEVSKEVTETQCVHNESPKEFKLSDHSCPTNLCNKPNGDSSPDKLKTSGQTLENCDSPIDTTSQQRESHLEKWLPLQRKPESNESRVLSKDVTITPPRASSLKERAQTKQDILTSKIKAHAEKEISAIKEKGFALRDGFIGKSSTKHLASGQGVNVRQRPPSLEVPKNHENTVSNDVLPKHPTEPSGTQTGPAKFVPAQSCAAITGRFAATTAHLEHLEKSANQTENRTVCMKEGKKHKDKEQADHTDVSGKQKDELQQKNKDEKFNERKKDQKQDAHAEVAHDKSATAEVEVKEAAKINSTPLNVVNGSKETIEAEDSLQIVGVVVTVRERKPSENFRGEITDETENECYKSELNKDRPSQGRDENNMDEKKPLFKVKGYFDEVDQNSYLENVQQTLSLETKKKHKTRNVAEEGTNLQQGSYKVSPDPQSETQPEPTTEKGTSVSVIAPAKDEMSETQTPLYKQNTTAEKTKDVTIKTATEMFSKSSAEMKTDKESNQHQTQTAQINEITRSAVNSEIKDSKAESLTKQLPVKEDTTVANMNQSCNIDGRSAPLQEKDKTLSENPSMDSPQLNHSKDFQDVNVCIERIAIRVVPAVTKEDSDEGTDHSKSFSSDMKHQQNIPSSCEEEANTSNNEHCSKGFTLRSEKMDESLEDKLAVQNVLSSVRKLSDSLKASSKPNSTSSEGCKAENKKLESNMQSVEGDYFQIQGATETSSEAHGNETTTEDKLKERELPGLLPNAAAISNESRKEIKSEVFVFSLDQSNKTASSKITQEENIKKEKLEREATLASNQTDGPRWSKTEKREVGQSDPICKHKEEQRHSSTVRRQSSREAQPTKTNPVPEKSDVKPKPKGRTSTIPEISALADYARLKVIVAEDKDETPVQEFPRNKKDGFFPLIHTRHSRPPVFTEGPKDLSVKEKLPNKTEKSAKVNKEPKSILFPIVEKEHQRTGMFKLGDKDKQEEMVLDAKTNLDLFKSKDELSNQKKINKSSTQTELGQENHDLGNVHAKNRQVMAPSFAASRTDNSSEVLTYLQPTLATEYATHPVKNESPEMQREKETRDKVEDGRKGGLKQEKLTSQCKEIKTTLQDLKPQSEEEGVSVHEKEQRKEDIKIKNMIEERRASLAEEERRATRREEDRRAREREAVAIMIKERREKQRQAEIKAEEERKAKRREEENVLKKQEAQTKQKIEPVMTQTDGRRTTKDERAEKLQEHENEMMKQQKEEINVQEEQQQQRAAEKEQRKLVQVEKQRRLAQEEHRRTYAQEEHLKGEAEENKQSTALKEQHRESVLEEQQRASLRERQRKYLQEEQQKLAEEQQKRAALEEQQKRAAQEEYKRKHALEELQRRAAQEERQRKALQEERQKNLEEEQRRAAQEEKEEEQQRRAAQEEQQRRAEKEEKQEQQRRAAQEEKQQRDAREEQQRRAAKEEQQRRVDQVEQQKRAAQEEKQEKQQKRVAQMEQQRRAAQKEQQIRAAQEEQLRETAQAEQQMRAAQKEQQMRSAQEEQQRRAAKEEHLRRTAQEEQQRRTAQIEQQMRAAQEEQQRRAAQAEQQMKAAQEEQQRRATKEEQLRRTAQDEQLRPTAQEEQQRKTAQIEQPMRDAQEEKQRRAAQEEQISALQREEQNKASQEEQQQRDVVEEQQSRYTQEEQQRRASQEEKQRRALQQRRVEEEHQRKAVEEKQQKRSALIEEHRQAKHIKEKIAADLQEETKRKRREEERLDCYSEEERIKLIHDQGKMQQLTEEQREGRWMKSDEKRAAENNILKEKEEKQSKQESSVHLEKNMAAQELMLPTKEKNAQAKKKEEDERDKAKNVQMEKQKRSLQKMDALQYYAISSADTEKKLNERHLSSSLSSRKTINQSVVESADELLYHMRPHKPNAAASPAPPLPRSNTSSPALGVKPLMFRVKDNTFRGSTFTKSVKPRFHKNFGEDFWMGSPLDRAEDEQETMRRSAGTPVSPEKGFNQFATNSESAKVLSASSPDFSTSIPHQRPFSRRSMAMDDDESRSIISNMSEDVESFATSAADVADVRGLFDCERPESACSFSSDASRSLGKPPTVPPKSEKALRRAQRLTSHRIKKERTKAAAGSLAGVESKVSSCPSSTEVCSSNHYAVASPHFSAPIAFAHAPTQGASLLSSHTESSHVPPHATGPISLPISSPDAGSPPSPPSVCLHASNKASKPTAPKTIAHVSTSSTPHFTNPHSAPMTQYHVESSHQSYPLTQRKVLQDLGSGQYFLVDVPVQVKTKTFFDPETGKYVQLNVRQSGQNISRTQPQQTFPQAQFQPQMQIKSQQQPLSQASFAAKPFVFYQGYHSCPQSYQPAVINSVHPNRSSGHLQHRPGESNTSTEGQQSSEGHQYSPEKTNYMDTVNDIKRTYNVVNNTQDSNDSLSECNSNNQLTESSVCEKDNATNSLYQPRDIITMSELEDFMETSDW